MKEITLNIPDCSYSTAEAYKSLRTNLKFCGEDKKVITITSSFSHEGKSSISVNLAKSLAEAGEKVILIDADMRKSMLSSRLHIREDVSGLSFFLSGQAKLTDVLYATNVPKLFIIFAGDYPPNPAELLTGASFKTMIDSLRKVADRIIIDSPPLGQVIDGAIIAGESDGALVVVESGAVSYKIVREVKGQLEKSGCPCLGIVLNKMKFENADYYGKRTGKKIGAYYGNYYSKKGK